MDDRPPIDAICVTCRCGKRSIVEPRWFNKVQACAACEAEFMVLMIRDNARWQHRVMFVDQNPPSSDMSATPVPQEAGPWFNVACECGRLLGVDRRLAGHVTRCSACNGEILIRVNPRPDGGNSTAIIRGLKRDALPPDVPEEMHLVCTCGEELLILKDFYESLIACGSCGIRLQLHLRHDPRRNRHELQATVVHQ
jgi:hypothetical protein